MSLANDRLISIQPPAHPMSNSNVAYGARMWWQCPEIPQVLGCRRVPKRHAGSAASRHAISPTPRQSKPAAHRRRMSCRRNSLWRAFAWIRHRKRLTRRPRERGRCRSPRSLRTRPCAFGHFRRKAYSSDLASARGGNHDSTQRNVGFHPR